MATFKHISSKNADYGAAEQYLTFEHDEFTMKPTLDGNGRLIPRDDYRISSLNCGGEDFAIACMRSNLKYGKNQKREDVKSHHYIISFDPRDAQDNGLTVDKAQELGERYCKEHFPGHQALICTHPDGHNHSGNIHVHIVINSLRIEEVPLLPYMDRPADTKAGCKHRCTDAAMEYFKAEVMEMCHRENLYQIDLLNGSKGIIDECIRHIYDKYFENPIPENMPLLEDLYDALKAHYNPKAERIANSLVLYVHGSQNYFNNRTNVDSKNRIMCFDIRDLGNQLKELGMLIVQDAVWNRVSKNRERKIATRYYCDEFHLLLREKQTAVYSVEIWKRFRKWGGIPTGLTQNVGDFLRSEEIEGILGNSDFVYLLNQNAKDQLILADKLGLSSKQLQHVTNSEPGSGLILFDNVVIPFVDRYPMDTKTYRIMTTKPDEAIKKDEVV